MQQTEIQTMTVGELRQRLADLPEDAPIYGTRGPDTMPITDVGSARRDDQLYIWLTPDLDY